MQVRYRCFTLRNGEVIRSQAVLSNLRCDEGKAEKTRLVITVLFDHGSPTLSVKTYGKAHYDLIGHDAGEFHGVMSRMIDAAGELAESLH